MKEFVTIQDSPKHKLLRAYDSDLGVQNPIGEADSHGFCIVTGQVLNSYKNSWNSGGSSRTRRRSSSITSM